MFLPRHMYLSTFLSCWLSVSALQFNLVRCGVFCPWCDRQEAERSYLLWKARQVADQQGPGAVAVPRGRRWRCLTPKEAPVDFAVLRLKKDLFPDLMAYMG
jgi:hypothetical protein